MDQAILKRLNDNLAQQEFLKYVGAEIIDADEGSVTFACDFDKKLTRIGNILNGGFIATMADAACGYAALSKVPENNDVLTIDLHISYLHPGNVDRLLAHGRVVKSGRTILVSEAILTDGDERIEIAKTTATFFTKPRKNYDKK